MQGQGIVLRPLQARLQESKIAGMKSCVLDDVAEVDRLSKVHRLESKRESVKKHPSRYFHEHT